MTARASGLGARESLRLNETYNTVLRYAYDVAFDRGAVGRGRRRLQYWLHDVPGRPVPLSTPAKARLMLQELGPTYVKVGQLVSSQSQLLPDDWEEELRKLQQDVAPFPYEQVRDIVTAELGSPPEELFDDFDPAPLAAASLGQVHRARLDGGAVAVKVQRPGISRQVKADLGILHNLSRFTERRVGWAREVGLAGIVHEFGAGVLTELDYYGEAYNARRLAGALADVPGIHVPVIHAHRSAARVLTMEFITGVTLTDVAALDAAGVDRDLLADNLTRAAVKMLLIDGFFHADPHPGNMRVDPVTGTITLLDLGMCGQLSLQQRFNLIQLMVVSRRRDVTGMGQVLRGLSTPYRTVDERGYARDFERRVSRFLAPEATSGLGAAVAAGFDVLRDNGLRLDPELTLALKVLVQAEVIAGVLKPGGGLAHSGYEITEELLREQLTTENLRRVAVDKATGVARDLVQRLPDLEVATLKWIDQYEKGRFSVHIDTSELGEQVRTIRGIGREALIALVLAGIIIGSGFAAFAAEGDESTVVSRLAYFTFVTGILAAVVFLIAMLRRLARDAD